jgi:hypothetical protein
MATIYEMTIFLAIALLAMVVTVFVLAASLLGRAIEEARDAEKRIEDELTRNIHDMEGKLKQVKVPDDVQVLEEEIAKFKKERKSLRKKSRLVLTRYELLTVNGSVLYPGLLFVGAMACAGAARWWADAPRHSTYIPYLLWFGSLAFILVGCYLVYMSLRAIESLAISTEEVQSKRMIEAFETALDRHERAQLPELALEFVSSAPPFKLNIGTEATILMNVTLTRGTIARKAELWFDAPKDIEFPGRIVVPADRFKLGTHQVRLECPFDLKTPVAWTPEIKLKPASVKGTFQLSYMLMCEGFDGDLQEFNVEVV